jgi:hypothetical protein
MFQKAAAGKNEVERDFKTTFDFSCAEETIGCSGAVQDQAQADGSEPEDEDGSTRLALHLRLPRRQIGGATLWSVPSTVATMPARAKS